MSSRRNSNNTAMIGRLIRGIFVVGVVAFMIFGIVLDSQDSTDQSAVKSDLAVRINPITRELASNAPKVRQDGVAIALLVDTSGSMALQVPTANNEHDMKIIIARRCALNVIRQAEAYAGKHPDTKIMLGIYEFGVRDRGNNVRQVIPFRKPDSAGSIAAINRMNSDGGTPIGDAMIVAEKAMNELALKKTSIIVITDGENNIGYSPSDVIAAINQQPGADHTSIYFIAFDVAAEKFNGVKDAGGLVLPASSESELQQAMEFVLSSKILAEKPDQK